MGPPGWEKTVWCPLVKGHCKTKCMNHIEITMDGVKEFVCGLGQAMENTFALLLEWRKQNAKSGHLPGQPQ